MKKQDNECCYLCKNFANSGIKAFCTQPWCDCHLGWSADFDEKFPELSDKDKTNVKSWFASFLAVMGFKDGG